MEEDVQFALSVYGFVIWGWAAFLAVLGWWAARPRRKNLFRPVAARSAFLMALSGATIMPLLFPEEAHLALLVLMLACAFLLWLRSETWPVYLFVLCGGVVFANDVAAFWTFLQMDDLLWDFVSLLTFQSEPSLDSFFDLFVGPLVYGSIVLLFFRLAVFALGAWAAVKFLRNGQKS